MSLEHPNVVPIYDAGDFEGHVYLAMRLVDGRDLGSLLRAEGALEPARVIAISTQIAAALDAAHARGLVHRDVKPSNVLLDSSEHVYLADFGLTRRLDDAGGVAADDFAGGTPAYLAPEQIEGRPTDGRTDIYALGSMLYECLTGEAVFPRSSRLAVAWAHLEEEPPKPSKRRAELPQAIDAVIERALAKNPAQRFPTCTALIASAENALGLGTARSSRRRRTLLLAAAGAVAIAVAAGVIATLLASGGGKPAPPLYAGPNTLARIDPRTRKVDAVVPVGLNPVVSAGSGHRIWVFSEGNGRVTEFARDPHAGSRRRSSRPFHRPSAAASTRDLC
jgi:serine/threonine-protein kinase